MSKFRHTVPGVAGSRVSEHIYTHAVVVHVNREWEKRVLMPARIRDARRVAKRDYAFYLRCATGNVGEPYTDYGIKVVRECPSVESFMDAEEVRIRSHYDNVQDTVAVTSWHHSALLADKAAVRVAPHYIRVEVREVVRTPK